MGRQALWLGLLAALLAALLAWPGGAALAQPIERSAAAVREFRRAEVCPVTGLHRGACRGWAVDHIRPLCAGGVDAPVNMQWISDVDHRFKTLVDVRECRRLRRLAATPAA